VRLRRQKPDLPRPFRVPGYPWLPGLFVLTAIAVLAVTILDQPVLSGEGLLFIAAGLPVYAWFRRTSR